jgi:hypothetical protein
VATRAATSADIDAITDVITLAFETDPVWSVALRRPDDDARITAMWRDVGGAD